MEGKIGKREEEIKVEKKKVDAMRIYSTSGSWKEREGERREREEMKKINEQKKKKINYWDLKEKEGKANVEIKRKRRKNMNRKIIN